MTTILWAALLALAPTGCGEATRDVPRQELELPCGLEPTACLDAPEFAIPERYRLVSSKPAFMTTLEPAEYLQTQTPGCQDQLVFDIGPEELTGSTFVIEAAWFFAPGSGMDCSDYDATVHVYGRQSDASFELVDFRILEGDENCIPLTVSAGVGDGLVQPPGSQIYLTPSRHALGLRVISAALNNCVPAPLTVRFAQEFQ